MFLLSCKVDNTEYNPCSFKSEVFRSFLIFNLATKDKVGFCNIKIFGPDSANQTSSGTLATISISNLVNNSYVVSGFMIGVSKNATKVEISLDGGPFLPATGITDWKFQFPNGSSTWRQFSRHTIQARATNSDNVATTTAMISVVKSRNKDLDGDGYGDAVFTAPAGTGAGTAHGFYGSSTGISESTATAANFTLVGETNLDYFGEAAITCDTNGDSYADIIVSASARATSTGKVYIFHGAMARRTGNILGNMANSQISGESTNDKFGSYLDCGDVNGDGFDDLATVSNNFSIGFANRGRGYVFHSAGATGITITNGSMASTKISGDSVNKFFAYNVVLGDFQNDGFLDLTVSNINLTTFTGEVRIFHSTSSAGIAAVSEGTASRSLGGEIMNGQFGYSLWSGDYNGDGFSDLVVGANTLATSRGKSYLFLSSGTSSGITIAGAATANINFIGDLNNDRNGDFVALVDLNNDGFAEFITSAGRYNAGNEIGRMYIQPGSASAPTGGNVESAITRRLSGSSSSGRFGAAMGFSDINGDGYLDLLTSANALQPAGGTAFDGVAYIFLNNKTNAYFTGNIASDANATITGQLNGVRRFGYNIGF